MVRMMLRMDTAIMIQRRVRVERRLWSWMRALFLLMDQVVCLAEMREMVSADVFQSVARTRATQRVTGVSLLNTSEAMRIAVAPPSSKVPVNFEVVLPRVQNARLVSTYTMMEQNTEMSPRATADAPARMIQVFSMVGSQVGSLSACCEAMVKPVKPRSAGIHMPKRMISRLSHEVLSPRNTLHEPSGLPRWSVLEMRPVRPKITASMVSGICSASDHSGAIKRARRSATEMPTESWVRVSIQLRGVCL